jgi:hypothetical protein
MTPLRQRMLEDMQLRNLAPATQKNYIAHVAAFARFFGRSPEALDQEAVRVLSRLFRRLSAGGSATPRCPRAPRRPAEATFCIHNVQNKTTR